MTPQERKVIELALEALQFALHVGFPESSESQIKKGEKAYQQHRAAITAIKEALAQPEQEPVAWIYESVCGNDFSTCNDPPSYAKNIRPLYTTPLQRKPLTDEQIAEMWLEILGSTPPSGIHEDGLQPWRFVRAIEAAHGIKE